MRHISLFVFLFFIQSSYAQESTFKNESELGLILAYGNTEAQTTNIRQKNSYALDANIFKFGAGYLFSRSNGVESARAWNTDLRYEYQLSEKLSLYLGQGVEGDKFAKIKQRYKTDLGSKYFFKKTDRWNWFLESGYRFTKENGFTQSRNLHYGRFYTELEKKWNPSVSSKYWLEFLPNISQGQDWQINSELSTSAALNETFSVKSAFLVKFDHEPNAGVSKKSDRLLTTALVAKF